MQCTIDDLVQRKRANEWIKEPGFVGLYVRISMRYISGVKRRTIDLANFEVADKGRGIFTRFIAKIEQYQLPIFVENVLNPRLPKLLLRLGFAYVENTDPPCFLKEVSNEPTDSKG